VIEQVPPNSPEVEQAYLGGLMVGDIARCERLIQGITSAEFYAPDHQEIFRVICAQVESGTAPTMVTVHDDLKDHPTITASQLAELGATDPLGQQVGEYRSRLLRLAQKRFLRSRLLATLEELQRSSHANLERPVACLEEIVHDFGETYPDESSQFARPLSECVDEFGVLLDRVAAGEQGIAGRPSGYTRLDQLIAGFQPGRLYTVAARTGAGKTTFVCNLAYQMAKSGEHCALFSLEMGANEIFQKLVAVDSGVDLHRLRQGDVAPHALQAARTSGGRVGSLPIYINDGNKLGLSLIERDCARLKQANQLDCVFVDYLQLMWTPPSRKARYEAVGELSRGLKAMARKLDVPVIACAQLSRKADEGDGEPKLHHLRESGSIEQDSDVVIFLWRDGDDTHARVAKNRSGPVGRLKFDFDPQKERFTDDSWGAKKHPDKELW
jgi:replicative DNA helicase